MGESPHVRTGSSVHALAGTGSLGETRFVQPRQALPGLHKITCTQAAPFFFSPSSGVQSPCNSASVANGSTHPTKIQAAACATPGQSPCPLHRRTATQWRICAPNVTPFHSYAQMKHLGAYFVPYTSCTPTIRPRRTELLLENSRMAQSFSLPNSSPNCLAARRIRYPRFESHLANIPDSIIRRRSTTAGFAGPQ